jgi:cell division protein FtsB
MSAAEVMSLISSATTHDDDTCPHLVVLGRLEAENSRLKAEVESMKKPAVIGGYNISEYIRMANSETLEFDNGDMFADMTLPERIKYIVESHARLRSVNEDNKRECEATRIENARLKAEVERLTAFTTRTIIPNEELQAQVERLTKSGDELWEFAKLADTNAPKARRKALKDWRAAKEGKDQL